MHLFGAVDAFTIVDSHYNIVHPDASLLRGTWLACRMTLQRIHPAQNNDTFLLATKTSVNTSKTKTKYAECVSHTSGGAVLRAQDTPCEAQVVAPAQLVASPVL